VLIKYPIGDPEALDLANGLAGLFRSAGWDTSPVYATPLEGTPEGVFFEVATTSESDRCFAAVQRAFKEAGLGARAQLNPAMNQGDFTVLVGHKPRG
jgi:hypothetical protein